MIQPKLEHDLEGQIAKKVEKVLKKEMMEKLLQKIALIKNSLFEMVKEMKESLIEASKIFG